MVRIKTSKLGIPEELNERIEKLLDFIGVEDQTSSINKPAPNDAIKFFISGISKENIES